MCQLAHGWQRMVLPSASKRNLISYTQRIPARWQRRMTSNNRRRLGVDTNLRKEIRRRAYEIYLARDDRLGNEIEDWLHAEAELRQARRIFQ